MTEDELKLEKLQLEINELRTKLSQQQRILSFLPLMTLIIAICGLWYNFYQFSISQENQNIKERNARRDEFRKPFFQKRLDLYEQAVMAASDVLRHPEGTRERKTAEDKFFQLYNGPLHLVADSRFSEAKVDYAHCLWRDADTAKYKECGDDLTRGRALQSYSIALAHAAQNSIRDSWKLDDEGLPIAETEN